VSKDGELRANLPGLRVWEDEKPVPDVVVAWGATVWGAPDGEGTLTWSIQIYIYIYLFIYLFLLIYLFVFIYLLIYLIYLFI
jgi:hypothetical protein